MGIEGTSLNILKAIYDSVQFSRSVVSDSVTPWITACQASLSITNSCSLLKLISIESVMPSNRVILCRPLLLLPPIPLRIRVFSNELTLRMRWPKYWSFSLAHSKYYSQWWKTASFPPKIINKTRVSTLSTIIQDSFESASYKNQRRKRNKRNPYQKRRNKALSVCWWHNTIHRKP